MAVAADDATFLRVRADSLTRTADKLRRHILSLLPFHARVRTHTTHTHPTGLLRECLYVRGGGATSKSTHRRMKWPWQISPLPWWSARAHTLERHNEKARVFFWRGFFCRTRASSFFCVVFMYVDGSERWRQCLFICIPVVSSDSNTQAKGTTPLTHIERGRKKHIYILRV